MLFAVLRLAVFAVAFPSLILGAHGLHVLGMTDVFLPLIVVSVFGSAACMTAPRYRWLGYFLFTVNCLMAISSVSASFLRSYDDAMAANEQADKAHGTEEANKAEVERLKRKLGDLTLSAANRRVVTIQNDQNWLLTNRCDLNARKTVAQGRYCNRVQEAVEAQEDAIDLNNRQNGRYYRGTTEVELVHQPRKRSISPVSEALLVLGSRILDPLAKPTDKDILLLLSVVLGITAEVIATFLAAPLLLHISTAEARYNNHRLVQKAPQVVPETALPDAPFIMEISGGPSVEQEAPQVPPKTDDRMDDLQEPEKLLVSNQSVGLSVVPIAPSAARFIEGRFLPGAGGNMLARPIYSTYTKWCKQKGLRAATESDFGKAMEAAGYTKGLVDRRQHFIGIRVREAKLEVVG